MDGFADDVPSQPKKQTAPQKVRAKLAEQRKEEFDAALADGSMTIRYMTPAERKSGTVKMRMKPRRRKR